MQARRPHSFLRLVPQSALPLISDGAARHSLHAAAHVAAVTASATSPARAGDTPPADRLAEWQTICGRIAAMPGVGNDGLVPDSQQARAVDPIVEEARGTIARMNQWCRQEVSRLAGLRQPHTAMQVIATAMEAARAMDAVAPEAASEFHAGLFVLADTIWDDRRSQVSTALLL